jgi:hypothetical protein
MAHRGGPFVELASFFPHLQQRAYEEEQSDEKKAIEDDIARTQPSINGQQIEVDADRHVDKKPGYRQKERKRHTL